MRFRTTSSNHHHRPFSTILRSSTARSSQSPATATAAEAAQQHHGQIWECITFWMPPSCHHHLLVFLLLGGLLFLTIITPLSTTSIVNKVLVDASPPEDDSRTLVAGRLHHHVQERQGEAAATKTALAAVGDNTALTTRASNRPLDSSPIAGALSSFQQPSLPQRQQRPTIHVLGERHSGTKWITQHLESCFNHTATIRRGLSRWKHWFQEANDNHRYPLGTPTIVVVQFRHVLQWVKAMQVDPYHAPAHFNLSWYDYVHRPWTMNTTAITTKGDIGHNQTCQYGFGPHQVIPCLADSAIKVHNDRTVYPCYELNPQTGLPYESILQLRRDKIYNFKSIRQFPGVDALFVVHYEEMVKKGTGPLLRKIESILERPKYKAHSLRMARAFAAAHNGNTTEATYLAQCVPSEPHPLTARPIPYKFVDWLEDHVDWEAEAAIGYKFEWDNNEYAKSLVVDDSSDDRDSSDDVDESKKEDTAMAPANEQVEEAAAVVNT